MKGELANHNDLRTCLKKACIEFNPRFWRIYFETIQKERFESAALSEPNAKKATSDMKSV